MHAILARLTLSPVLLPGASGRTDVSAQARTVVVDRLTSLLEEAGLNRPGAGSETDHPHVLVVAPARRSMIAVGAQPDLGSLGLLAPSAPGRAGAGAGVGGGQPTLGVTATVAVTLLGLAGWHGPVETLEVAGGADDDADSALDRVVSSGLSARRLVLLATGTDDAGLPTGTHQALAAAHVRVRALGDRLDAVRAGAGTLVD